jgi:hypothetical protein
MVAASRGFDLIVPRLSAGFRGGHMRQFFALWVLLLCCGFASAQDTWIYPGQYAEPSAPRLSTPVASPEALPTPFLTLDTPPMTVGASNSTLQNPDGSPVYYNQLLRYQPGVEYNAPYNPPAQVSVRAPSPASGGRYGIDLGAATSQMDFGVAQLAGIGPRKKAKKTYTNPDVAAVNEAAGTIKFRGKIERVN